MSRYFLGDFRSSFSKFNCLHTLKKPHVSHHLLTSSVWALLPPTSVAWGFPNSVSLGEKNRTNFFLFFLEQQTGLYAWEDTSHPPKHQNCQRTIWWPSPRTKLMWYLEGEQKIWSFLSVYTAAEEHNRLGILLLSLLSASYLSQTWDLNPTSSHVLPLFYQVSAYCTRWGRRLYSVASANSGKSSSSLRKNKTSGKQLVVLRLYISHIAACLSRWTNSLKPKLLSTWRSEAEPLRRQRLKRNSTEVSIPPKSLWSHSSPSRTWLFEVILWVLASTLFPQTLSQLRLPPSREFDF